MRPPVPDPASRSQQTPSPASLTPTSVAPQTTFASTRSPIPASRSQQDAIVRIAHAYICGAPDDIRIDPVPDPASRSQQDAIVRITHAYIRNPVRP